MSNTQHSLISRQFEELRKVNELLDSEGYNEILLPYLQSQIDAAHDQILNLQVDGPKLQIARARYVAARDLQSYLKVKQTALIRSIERQRLDAEDFGDRPPEKSETL